MTSKATMTSGVLSGALMPRSEIAVYVTDVEQSLEDFGGGITGITECFYIHSDDCIRVPISSVCEAI